MKIVGTYSFNGAVEAIQKDYSIELDEIKQILSRVNAYDYQIKRDETQFDLRTIGKSINNEFARLGWKKQEIYDDSPSQYYIEGYKPPTSSKPTAKEIDFTKNQLGVDVEFDNKPTPVYSGCAKMTIFHNMGFIDVGIEIVPVKELAEDMSSGVSCFEQFVWDLEQRGVADIDIPVLILGVAP